MDRSARGGRVPWMLGALCSVAAFGCDEGPKCPPATICTPVGMQDGGLEPPKHEDAGGPTSTGSSDPSRDGGGGGMGAQVGDRDGGSAQAGGSGGRGGSTSPPPPLSASDVCGAGGLCIPLAAYAIDKIDLLFMVDDSGSMAEEQESLRVQFPRLIRELTSGDRGLDGSLDFKPAKSLHLGVVSSDLGLVRITGIDKCMGLGDDGVMNDVASPSLTGCSPNGYPRFLTYAQGIQDPQQAATDLACIAVLGEDGCGFEQQLESTLKALWPADDSRVTFLPDPQGFGAVGQGDNGGMNAGFLRNDPIMGLSLIAIVIVTDEEDCSARDTSFLRPPADLDPNDPADAQLLLQGLNTRCHFNAQHLYAKERYINGFKALRPGNEHLVVVSGIIGVPPETVAQVPADFAENPAARDAFYAGIKNHVLMQPMVDTLGTPSPDDDFMRPSCNTPTGKAYPPNRIVDVIEGFGANGMVQSICQDDFGAAFDAIVDRIGSQLGNSCLERPLVRHADGSVGCDVVWVLPPPARAPTSAPTQCSERPFLSEPDGAATAADGSALCKVVQLGVTDGATPQGDGWYYDDFSGEAVLSCAAAAPARIAFTPSALPPTGVRAFLDCAP